MERFSAHFREKYPHAMVPMLELDDGTQIGEAMAIAQYFEETVPEPKLMGIDAKDRAIVAMWEKRANEEGMLPASELFRNTHPNFSERGLPGEEGYALEIFNTLGQTLKVVIVPASAIKALSTSEVWSARAL